MIHRLRRKLVRDRLGLNDYHAGLRGEVIIGRNPMIETFVDPFGRKSWRTTFGEIIARESNIVPIGGYQTLFTKLFNFLPDDPDRSNLMVGDLNNHTQLQIGVSPDNYIHQYYTAETSEDQSRPLRPGIKTSANNTVFGFMIGDGGAREDNITAISPDYKRRIPYHAIPFRITDNPEGVWADKYFGRWTDMQGMTSFYVKRFEATATYPHLVHAWKPNNTNTFQPVDDSVFASTSSVPIESYVEMMLRIDIGDGLEYFQRANVTPRINELCLVSGWYNAQLKDWETIRVFTHFCRPSLVLTENDWVEIIYRLYAR